MAPASSSTANKPSAALPAEADDNKKAKKTQEGQPKKEGKETSNSQLALQMQAKLMRELRRQKDAPASVSTSALRAAPDAVATKDPNWLKNACHWQDSRAHAALLARHDTSRLICRRRA